MSKWVIAGFLVTASLGGIESAPSLWFSKKDWQSFLSAKKCEMDALLLSDGTQICGEVEKLPSLKYSFTNLNFDPEKVSFFALSETGQGLKYQIVTRDGQNYLASLGKGKFVIHIFEDGQTIKKEIDPKKVRLAVLKERKVLTSPGFKTISTIDLRNGDSLPVILSEEPIVLTDGWRELSLQPSEIIELSFNGGVHGKVLEGGLPTQLNFKFIQDPTLSLTIPQGGEKVKLPWEQIERVTTFNGGFRDEGRQIGSLLNTLSGHIKNAFGDKPESFGNNKGKLLEGASGALALLPQAFDGLADLGQEEINDAAPAAPIFDSAEEAHWNLHIAFEESAPVEQVEQIAMLDPDQLREIKEALVFDAIQKVDLDPPTFDVPDAPPLETTDGAVAQEDEKIEAHVAAPVKAKVSRIEEKDPDLTDEELELLEGLLAHESLTQSVIDAVVKPKKEAVIERRGMTYVAEEKIALRSEVGMVRGILLPTSGKPTLLVKVPSFYIDTKPVTNAEYQVFVLTTNYPPPPHWGGTKVPEGLEDKPVVNVSCKDAEAYAAWAGRRLPSQLEWSSAVKGKALESTQNLKEWSATSASAHSKFVFTGAAFVTRNENWLDHATGFRTIAD